MKRVLIIAMALLTMFTLFGCTYIDELVDTFNGDTSGSSTQEEQSKKILATIKTNSGETKKMTMQEIRNIEETNSVLFESEYIGADITVTSTIVKIGGAYMLTSWFDCDAYVELESDDIGYFFKPITKEYAKTLNVGDTITVSGKIGMASVAGLDIYIMKDKISPY